jgi:hypothetical protein
MTDEGEGEEGKLPSVDHGRRTNRGRDKNTHIFGHFRIWSRKQKVFKIEFYNS